MGTLPALKVLITTRGRASENQSGSGGSHATTTPRPKTSSFGTPTKSVKSVKSVRSVVALSSLRRDSNNLKSASTSDANESQEEILVQRDVVSPPIIFQASSSDGGMEIELVEHWLTVPQTVSYSQVPPRPSPMRYHQRYQDPC